MKLAVGRVESCPFPEDSVLELKRKPVEALESTGHGLGRTAEDRVNVPLDYRLLQSLLTAAHRSGSPGWARRAVHSQAPLSAPEQEDPLVHLEDRSAAEGAWNQNYRSVAGWTKEVLAVLDDQSTRGQVLKLTEEEARARFPNLVVASMGAIRKDNPDCTVSARVLFDGTNGVEVNKRTRIRDQERAPIAADLKRVMREKARVGERTFALSADVKEAHRQVPVAPCDWHLLGCQVQPGGSVYVNKVGTFGVASASYWWSRVATAVGRLSQYCAGHSARTWHMLVADDFHLEAGGAEYRSELIVFFVLCAVSGVPLSWNKTAGGDVVAWVGFELLHRSHKVGLTLRRAEWFVRWTREVAGSRTVNMSNFEEGLGRVMYVAGALEYERPFLAPLFMFLSLHPRGSARTVPAHVTFFLNILATQMEECRHTSCVEVLLSSTSAPQVDAQPSETRTGIGGWLPTLRADGTIDTKASLWFSLEIREEDFPWIFEKSGKPALVISTLETLAVLVALKVFVCKGHREHRTRVQVPPTWTDNRGNGSALSKLMTTKFPSSALMMELSSSHEERIHQGVGPVGSTYRQQGCRRPSERAARRRSVRATSAVWTRQPWTGSFWIEHWTWDVEQKKRSSPTGQLEEMQDEA